MFYSYRNFTAGSQGYYPKDALMHAELADVQLDLSDHYPLTVEMEMKPRKVYLDVTVRTKDIGDVTFNDNEWAGTRGDIRSLEGFKLAHKLQNIKFQYRGDDGPWLDEGHYAGHQGKAITKFAIKMEGSEASSYMLKYRAHVANEGDTDWVSAEGWCPPASKGNPIEAISIVLEKKS